MKILINFYDNFLDERGLQNTLKYIKNENSTRTHNVLFHLGY